MIRDITHFSGFVTQCMAVYALQDTVRAPTSPLHDISIRDSQCVLDARGIMSKVVEPKMRYSGMLQDDLEAV